MKQFKNIRPYHSIFHEVYKTLHQSDHNEKMICNDHKIQRVKDIAGANIC